MAVKVATTIKLDLKKAGCEGMDWSKLAQDRDRWWIPVNIIMNMQVP
jgi:hypothetical protein